jgi:hypothetical protein
METIPVEEESKKYPGMKEMPFDLTMLTDREKHNGFFVTVFTDDGVAHSLWDKMDGNKFGRAMESFVKVAVSNSPRNIETLIKMLEEIQMEFWEKGLLSQEAEVVESGEPGDSAGPKDTMPTATESEDKQEMKLKQM